MNAVYEGEIEIALTDAIRTPSHQEALIARIVLNPRLNIFRILFSHLIDLFKYARYTARKGKYGYVGSFYNCDFLHLYEVFGVDVIGFLFDKRWVPHTTIDSFEPNQFLARLAVLEEASRKIRVGDALPVFLVETAPYWWPSDTRELKEFATAQTEALKDSFRELRDFGKLGQRLKRRRDKLTVEIKIASSEYKYSPEILSFVTQVSEPNLANRDLIH